MNSGRKTHLPANMAASLAVAVVDGVLFLSPQSAITGVACFMTELWAWPDRDLEHKRKGFVLHWYWLVYEKLLIPRHRHPLSHSLLPGLIIRLVWGFWPLMLLWVDVVTQGIMAGAFPLWLLTVPLRCIVGAIVSDCIHYLFDGYLPHEMLFGKLK